MPSGKQNDVRKRTKERVKTIAKFKTEGTQMMPSRHSNDKWVDVTHKKIQEYIVALDSCRIRKYQRFS